MLRMSPFAVRWLLAEYEPPVSSQVQQLRLVLLSFPPSVISFFFFKTHILQRCMWECIQILSDWTSVQMAQLTSHTIQIAPLWLPHRLFPTVWTCLEYYLLLLRVRCGTAVEHIPVWCSADCHRACLHQRKNTKTRTSCTFIATVSVIWLTLRFFFIFLL